MPDTLTVINDIHIGTRRKAGTTPLSQETLRNFIFNQFEDLLKGKVTVINGDLFDGFEVDTRDVLETHRILSEYVKSGGSLVLIMGNHDASAKGSKVSSFHFLCHVLRSQFPDEDTVQIIDHTCGFTQILHREDTYAVPHMLNQTLFDLELEKAVHGPGGYLLLHANFDNNFAAESDHSLNVSDAVADKLIEAGWTLLFAHEHNQRTLKSGKVVIDGNQIPTSVADCIGCDTKYYATISDSGLELVKVLDISDVFVRADWRELDKVPEHACFIRVQGEAQADEANQVVNAVSCLRQGHTAFVISNAVAIQGLPDFDEMAEMTADRLSHFNVLEALLEELDEREGSAVKQLLETT